MSRIKLMTTQVWATTALYVGTDLPSECRPQAGQGSPDLEARCCSVGGKATAGDFLFTPIFKASRDFDYRDGNLGLTDLELRLEAFGGGSGPTT